MIINTIRTNGSNDKFTHLITNNLRNVLTCTLDNDVHITDLERSAIREIISKPSILNYLKNKSASKYATKYIFTRKEAADYLSMSVSWLDKKKKNGEISFQYYGAKAIRFNRFDLDDYIRKTRIS